MAYMLSKGLAINTQDLDQKIFKKLKRKLTVEHRGFNQQIKTIQAYRIDRKDHYIQMAHARGYELLKELLPEVEIINLLSRGRRIVIDNINYNLAHHQQLIVDYLLRKIFNPKRAAKGRSRCIFQLKAGMGKTYIAVGLIAALKRKTLYIVPGENLVIQTVAKLREVFPELIIGEYYGKNHNDGHIVVASIDSLYKAAMIEYGHEMIPYTAWFKLFGLTIIDEIQLFCTTKRAEIFRRIASLYVVGMTATANDRLDKMDRIAHYYVGEPIIITDVLKDEMPEDEKIEYGVQVKKIIYNGPDEYTQIKTIGAYNAQKGETVESTSHPMMINQFSTDPYRIQLIVDRAMRLYRRGHSFFIFFDRRHLIECLLPIFRSLVDRDEVEAPEIEVRDIKGGATNEDRTVAKDRSRICLITYQCGGVGLSYPRYTASIFAHSRRNNYKQFNNRIFRLDGPREVVREIEYICDNKTPLKSQFGGFKSALKEEYPKAKIVELEFEYGNIEPTDDVKKVAAEVKKYYDEKSNTDKA